MKSFIVIFIIFIILPLDVDNQSTSRKNGPNMYSVKAERLTCQNSSYCFNPICRIKHVARDKQLLYGSCNLTKVITTAMVHFRFYYKYYLTYQPFIVDIREDLCGFLENKKSLHITSNIFAAIKDHISPQPFKCPMNGNIMLRNAPFNLSYFPQMLPAGQYRADMRVYSNRNETIIFAQFYTLVEGQSAINFG